MKIGNLIYVRYVGNIRHWSREVFQAPIIWIGSKHFTIAINGQTSCFDRATLRHDNRGHSPSYQLFLTLEAYQKERELADLRSLMKRTNLMDLSVEKQRAVKAIVES